MHGRSLARLVAIVCTFGAAGTTAPDALAGCTAFDEICDGLDDDCDGTTDEDFPQREDIWSAIATAPAARTNHTAVWSGAEMIVFGGDNGAGSVQVGGYAYAPASNGWRAIAGGPAKRWRHTAVWTGTRMIVWGGDDNAIAVYSNGSRYDPATDTWLATSLSGAPAARALHSAVWTGSRMVVWGGRDAAGYFSSGSRYDPTANNWSATATTGAPAARAEHSAVWTGTHVIVWGGVGTGQIALGTGSRYDPASNTWSPMTTTGAPSARYGHVVAWTGSKMLVWGGTEDGLAFFDDGASYDPDADLWSPITTFNGPSRRAFASSAWTGTELLIWGGTYRTNETPNTPLSDGARYNPAGATRWEPPMNEQFAGPAARARAAAVWTGNEMIVWGGDPNGAAMSSGGRYIPVTLCGFAGCQAHGRTYCSAAAVGFQCTPLAPSPEVCNQFDDDCNGVDDDGIPVPSTSPVILATKLGFCCGVSFGWSPTPDTTGYDIVMGALSTLRSTSGNFAAAVGACLHDDRRQPEFGESSGPVPADDGYWYLVRAVNTCTGNGSYDGTTSPPQQGSRDAEIAASSAACP